MTEPFPSSSASTRARITLDDGIYWLDKNGTPVKKIGPGPQREEGTSLDFTVADELRKAFGNRPLVKEYNRILPNVKALRDAEPCAADINIVLALEAI
ncbi:hypothetical protein FHP25_05405 [Vineibacter terrae]|uniref:Uncharacterized protein n=1 Tax=Vineibacter terrae TaxID=2586908 RepID=A0A5C8PTX8_9HYPH|nr:hypothetical protein [Vineibacter terrae]TXL80463.1 hypothetical protein FHP25_05405 [Vineibacter terrae]